jgi:hypothetical protein
MKAALDTAMAAIGQALHGEMDLQGVLDAELVISPT